MKLSTALDVDMVAHESADEVTVLLELTAPAAPETNRSPAALQIVLDRSGSMDGAPLEGAKKALAGVVAQLNPADVFGVVTFDDTAQVVVPAAPLSEKTRAVRQFGRSSRVDAPTSHRATCVDSRIYDAPRPQPVSAAARSSSSATDTSTAGSPISAGSPP